MNESKRLANQIDRALNGEAWHGPSWREVLDGLGYRAATSRPIPEAHTLAEIMLHAATWNDVVRRRLGGESPEVSDAENFPSTAGLTSDGAWEKATARFFDSGRALVDTVERFPVEKLLEKRPGVDGTWYELMVGQLQHLLYHAGQAALLRKARVPAEV